LTSPRQARTSGAGHSSAAGSSRIPAARTERHPDGPPALQKEQLETGDRIARAPQQLLGAGGPVGPLERARAGDEARAQNAAPPQLAEDAPHFTWCAMTLSLIFA
jgi:hypothetical protein